MAGFVIGLLLVLICILAIIVLVLLCLCIAVMKWGSDKTGEVPLGDEQDEYFEYAWNKLFSFTEKD